MGKKSIYDGVETLFIKRIDERLPFFIKVEPRPDWDEVYEYWKKYIYFMKRHNIKIPLDEDEKREMSK